MESPPPAARLARIPIRDVGEPLVDVRAPLDVAGTIRLRQGLVDRLVLAQSLLPRDRRLLLVHGHSQPGGPRHATGGAVDLTLSTSDGVLPTCRTRANPVPPDEVWTFLAATLPAAGLVNHPGRWWHWSYGDRFWAYTTKASHARYGPVFS